MKKLNKFFSIPVFFLFFALLFTTVDIKAETVGKVTGLTQTDASTQSISIQWNDAGADAKYEVCVSQDMVNWTSEETYSNQGYIYDLSPCTSYYVKVRAYVEYYNPDTYDYVPVYGEFSDVFECITLPEVNGESMYKVKATTNSLTVKWDAVSNASGYAIECYYYDSTYTKQQMTTTVNTNSLTLTKLATNKKYYINVYPYRLNAAGTVKATSYDYISGEFKLTPTKAKIKDIKIYKSLKQVTYSVEDVDIADGYQVQIYSVNGNKKLYSKTVKNYYGDVKKKNFSKAEIFKIRARAYIEESGKKVYGDWSGWTYFSNDVNISKIENTGKGLKLTWDKIKGADRYVIYHYNKSTKKSTKVKTLKGSAANSYTVTKIGKSKLKNNKYYYFYIVPYEKVNGKYIQVNDPEYVHGLKFRK